MSIDINQKDIVIKNIGFERNKIKVLDNIVINKIAAGEVIERPASIIKELVENSIDAGAKNIVIEIKNGGINFIKVIDNGCGIEKNEIKTAFLNHATSKIKDIKDFDSLSTLGFRGEALCTIAAIANVEMLSKTQNESLGNYIKIQGGEVLEEKEIAINQGTSVIVQNLFYNTPARLKFLKKPSVEASYISNIINKLALANPNIAFKFINNNKLIFNTSGNGDLRFCLVNILGKDINKNILELDFRDNNFYLYGFISRPGYSRNSRSQQNFFINNRYIKNDIVIRAIENAYKNNNKITVGQFPVYVLNLCLDPNFVDVNVHPSKLEVRFASDDMIYDFLFSAIDNLLKKASMLDKAELNNEFIRKTKPEKNIFASVENMNINIKPDKDFSLLNNNKNVFAERKADFKICRPEQKINLKKAVDPADIDININKELNKNNIKHESFVQDDLNNIKKNLFEDYKIIGCVFNTYWVIEKDKDIFLVDQHAAHERILFEALKNKYDNKKNILSQRLIYEISFVLADYDKEILLDNLDLIKDFGFDINYIDNKFVISAVPCDLKKYIDKDFFVDLIEVFKESNLACDKNNFINKINMLEIITKACKKAVKAKDKLSYLEIKELINKIMTAENPFNCPHGRPVLIKISQCQIEKLFMRKK